MARRESVRRPSDLSLADIAPPPRQPITPPNVTIRWLSRQLVETYGRACAAGDLRIELAALNALAKLHGLNKETEPMPIPSEAAPVYLPDNGRD